MAGEAHIQIAVCDPASSYRLGIGAAFADAGYTVEGYAVEDGEIVRAQHLDRFAVLLFTVRSAHDWQLLRDVRAANPQLKLVALLVDATPDRHAEALRCGADGVVAWEAPPERILAVVSAALDGSTLLPVSVAQGIAVSCRPAYDPEWITPEEVEWLRLLAKGMTIQQLAEKAGFSERALYRVLHGLYGRMRVSNRTEAILQAGRWGLLED